MKEFYYFFKIEVRTFNLMTATLPRPILFFHEKKHILREKNRQKIEAKKRENNNERMKER